MLAQTGLAKSSLRLLEIHAHVCLQPASESLKCTQTCLIYTYIHTYTVYTYIYIYIYIFFVGQPNPSWCSKSPLGKAWGPSFILLSLLLISLLLSLLVVIRLYYYHYCYYCYHCCYCYHFYHHRPTRSACIYRTNHINE